MTDYTIELRSAPVGFVGDHLYWVLKVKNIALTNNTIGDLILGEIHGFGTDTNGKRNLQGNSGDALKLFVYSSAANTDELASQPSLSFPGAEPSLNNFRGELPSSSGFSRFYDNSRPTIVTYTGSYASIVAGHWNKVLENPPGGGGSLLESIKSIAGQG
jgi:hypothetical protein